MRERYTSREREREKEGAGNKRMETFYFKKHRVVRDH
jgi:hypothetical protein